jgi:hypothetical protein
MRLTGNNYRLHLTGDTESFTALCMGIDPAFAGESIMPEQYIIDTEVGEAFGMSDGRIGKTICAVVKFDADGKVARHGRRYWLGEEPRNLKAALGRTRQSFQSYFERTGNRWEVEQEDKKRAEREAKELAAKECKAVQAAGPDLLAALKIARRIVAKAVKEDREPENALQTIDAAIKKAKYVPK